MKILVIGNGFIGQRVAKHFHCKIHKNHIDTIYQAEKACRGYDVVINCAGYADVDGCHNNILKAIHENKFLPQILSHVTKRLIHISTGCFIDGYLKPEHNFDGKSVYAKTKAVGEVICGAVVRIRLPYSDVGHKKELFTKMLSMNLLHNEQNSYTSIEGLLDDLSFLIKSGGTGIFHSVHDSSTPVKIGKMLNHKFNKIDFNQIQSKVKRVNVIMDNNIQPVKPYYKLKATIKRRWNGKSI